MKAILIASLALFSGMAISADVYKWQDEKGRWHFGSSAHGSGNSDVSVEKVKPNASGLSSCKGDCREANKAALQNEKKMLSDRGECTKLYYLMDAGGRESAKKARDECLTNKSAERLRMEGAKVGTESQAEHANRTQNYQDQQKANSLNKKLDDVSRKLDQQKYGY